MATTEQVAKLEPGGSASRRPPWTVDGEPAPPEARMDAAHCRAMLRAFHGLRNRMLWSPRHGWIQLATTAYLALWRVVEFFVGIPRMAQVAGPSVRRRWGVPVRRQILEMVRVRWRYGLGPKDYYENRLYEPGRSELAEFVIRTFHNVEIFAGFHGWADRLFDKLEFDARARAAGLPVIPILATCPAGGPPRKHLPDSPLWKGDLFSKSAEGGRGVSQRRWRRTPDGGLSDGRDSVASTEELLDLLCRPARRGRTAAELLQPCLANHVSLRELTGGGLSTVRVCTAQRSRGRPPEVVYLRMKLVVGDAPVDNLSAGGNLVAAVDLATGRLGQAFRLSKQKVMERVTHHPDTGREIEGFQLPFWRDVLDLCIEGQGVFCETPSLGWDVAMTPEGPVLVEANIMWGAADLLDWPLGLTPYPRWTAEWLLEQLPGSGGRRRS